MSLIVCTTCGEHHYDQENFCPHCNASRKIGLQINTKRTSMAILLGLALVGCGDKDGDTAGDTAAEPSSEPTAEPVDEPIYGVAEANPETE